MLAIFLGAFGAHKFYLGNTGAGIAYLLVAVFGIFLCGIPTLVISLVAFVEGIILLTSATALDAQGRLLRS